MDLLILDDRGLVTLAAAERRDLFEILEDRHGRKATIVTSQLPVDAWHEVIADPTIADAILDRLVHNAPRLELTGDSMRKRAFRRAALDPERRDRTHVRVGRGHRPRCRGTCAHDPWNAHVLTESQLAALEKAKTDKQAHGAFESEHPGYCVAQDTFHVGTLKGVGRVYQQTAIDTYAKIGFAKLYDRKTALTAADLLNDRVIPFFEEHELRVDRVLTDRGTECCGARDRHGYELYLAIEDIDHTRTKTKSPQTNGICERFHKTVLDEFYRVAFRKRVYDSIDALQSDLDPWMEHYNEVRIHQGRRCFGKTPMQTLLDSRALAREKQRIGEAA